MPYREQAEKDSGHNLPPRSSTRDTSLILDPDRLPVAQADQPEHELDEDLLDETKKEIDQRRETRDAVLRRLGTHEYLGFEKVYLPEQTTSNENGEPTLPILIWSLYPLDQIVHVTFVLPDLNMPLGVLSTWPFHTEASMISDTVLGLSREMWRMRLWNSAVVVLNPGELIRDGGTSDHGLNPDLWLRYHQYPRPLKAENRVPGSTNQWEHMETVFRYVHGKTNETRAVSYTLIVCGYSAADLVLDWLHLHDARLDMVLRDVYDRLGGIAWLDSHGMEKARFPVIDEMELKQWIREYTRAFVVSHNLVDGKEVNGHLHQVEGQICDVTPNEMGELVPRHWHWIMDYISRRGAIKHYKIYSNRLKQQTSSTGAR